MRLIMARKSSRTNCTRALALSTLMTGGLLAAFVPVAHADEVSPDGKGIVGGALLGAEVVTVTESLAGVRAGWAYGVFGGAGAVAGGVGGYFVEHASSDGQGAVYLLAGGMALIIPAVVLTLNATRYHPSDSATEDKPPPGIPADPGSPSGSAVTGPGVVAPAPSSAPAGASPPATGVPTSSLAPTSVPVSPSSGTSAASRSLVDLGIAKGTSLRFGLPVPEMRPMYSAAEQKTYGLPQHAELRMPVFRLSF
jgi:MFS family permease